MKTLRLGVLCAALALVIFFAVDKPHHLQQLVFGVIGQERIYSLIARFAPPQEPPAAPVTVDGAPQTTTARRLLQDYKSKSQLKPDRRFALATERLFTFVSGQSPIPAETVWDGEKWVVTVDRKEAGTLPAFPNYQAGSAFVQSWLRQLGELYPSNIPAMTSVDSELMAGVDGFNPRLLTSMLADLNSSWLAGDRHGGLLHQAVKSLSRLALVSSNSLGFADDIVARALAMTLLAKSINRHIDYREYESQIAYAMGYESDARFLARDMSTNNLWRMYLFKQDKKLIATVKSKPQLYTAKYYLLRRLAEQDYTAAWYKFLNQYYAEETAPFHALMTGYQLNDWPTFQYLSYAIPMVVVEYVGGNRVWKRLSNKIVPLLPRAYGETLQRIFAFIVKLQGDGIEETYRQFKQNLDEREHLYSGPFLDSDSWRLLQQSFFVTSIYRYGECAIDCSNEAATAKRFAAELNRVDSDEAKLLGYYFGLLARAKNSKLDRGEVIEAIDAMQDFGAEPMFRLFDEIKYGFEFGSPEAKRLVYLMVEVMDSRIDNRYDFANAMHSNLLDLSTAHVAFKTIVRDQPETGLQVQLWLARYFERTEDIVALFHRRRNDESDARALLKLLSPEQVDELGLDQLFTPLLTRFAGSWNLRRQYIEGLERAGRFAEARQQALEWLELDAEKVPINILRAQVYVARSYRFENDLNQALDVLKPTLINDFGWGFYEATIISLRQGNYQEAIKIAETIRGHFPDSRHSAENLIRAYWSGGAYKKAAELLEAGLPYSDAYWRRTLGRIYAEVFKVDTAAGITAFNALLNARIDHIKLTNLTLMASELGNHELAFSANDKLFFPGPGIMIYKLKAYSAMKLWQGEEKALAWLRQQVPADWVNMSSETMMYERHYDLLWQFIDRPELGEHPYGVWLVRTAAYVMEGKRDPTLHAQLLEYYASPDHDTYYDDLGRMALGLDAGDSLLDAEKDMLKVGEVAFYKGVQEFGKGNYYAAADWFKAVLETGVIRNAEYKWAQGRLYVWMSRAKDIGLQLASSRDLQTSDLRPSQ